MGHHGHIDGLRALVVGNACIDDVDADALDGQRRTPGCQPQAQHEGRAVRLQQRAQVLQRLAECRGQLCRHHLVARDALPCQGAGHAPAGVDRGVVERVEAREQDGGHGAMVARAQ